MKRTKKQKIKAQARRVNTQLAYKFEATHSFEPKNNSADIKDKSNSLASIKKELFKSLIIASLILISLVVIYWVSN